MTSASLFPQNTHSGHIPSGSASEISASARCANPGGGSRSSRCLKSIVTCARPRPITARSASANVATPYVESPPGTSRAKISRRVSSFGSDDAPFVRSSSSRLCRATRWPSLVALTSTSTHSWPAATAAANAGTVFGRGRAMPASAGQAEAPTVPCAHTSGGSGREQNELEGARNEEAGAERDRTTEEATEEVNEEEEGGPRAPGASSPGGVGEEKSRETRTIVVRLERMTSSARFCRVAAGGEGRRTGQREDERGNDLAGRGEKAPARTPEGGELARAHPECTRGPTRRRRGRGRGNARGAAAPRRTPRTP